MLVVVVSTTGDGDPPETVRRAWRKLKGKSLTSTHLQMLNFALLGERILESMSLIRLSVCRLRRFQL